MRMVSRIKYYKNTKILHVLTLYRYKAFSTRIFWKLLKRLDSPPQGMCLRCCRHFVLRYRRMSPEIARQALTATHGGLSLAWSATICHISPMTLYHLICALGQH